MAEQKTAAAAPAKGGYSGTGDRLMAGALLFPEPAIRQRRQCPGGEAQWGNRVAVASRFTS